MELDYNKIGSNKKSLNESEPHDFMIQVKANISCPICGTCKRFKNQFHLRNIESMVASLKVLDWLTCSKCGELLNLNLDFEI